MRFDELQLIDPVLRAIQEQGYTEPTPIQEQAIPYVLAGRDLIGLAQTGTGKTAAFALPIIQRLYETRSKGPRYPRVLVLAPTRELAAQIGESFDDYGRFTRIKQATIFGGVNQNPQVDRIKRGVDVVVATPGRLLDLMQQGFMPLDRLEVLVLDEADRMLDMGFLPDIKRVIRHLPTERQTLLFSATMPPDIQALAATILDDPVEVAVTPESTTVEAIEQRVFFVEKNDKRKLLHHLLVEEEMPRTLVFTRTKHGANRLSDQLSRARISAEAIHGNKSQRARQTALANFKQGTTRVLVATDIAARGIDVDEVTHVVNFDLPNETESYVHRIGRTGRAGAQGIALSFCALDERDYLADIERLIQMHIPVAEEHPYPSAAGLPEPTNLDRKRSRRSSSKSSNGAKSSQGKSSGNRPASHRSQNGERGGPSGGNSDSGGGKSRSSRRRRSKNQQRSKTTS